MKLGDDMGKVVELNELKRNDFIAELSDLIEYSLDTENPVALFATGLAFYEDSNYHTESFDSAISFITMSADLGFGPAQIKLANILRYEFGGDKDVADAFQLLKKAASKGMVEAQLELAQMILETSNEECDVEEAVKWVNLSAKGGCSEAMLVLAEMHEAGLTEGITKDECDDFVRQAAEAGVAAAMTRMGVICIDNGNETEGVDWLLDAADAGDDDAIAIISKNNLWKLTKADDIQICIDRLQSQLIAGNAKCGIVLGDYYSRDTSDRPSLVMAIEFYGAASVHGEEEAQEKMMSIIKLLFN